MDDLLALMEENPPDRSLQSQDDHRVSTNRRQKTKTGEAQDDDGVHHNDEEPVAKTALSQQERLCLSVDGKVGIRMMNRNICGAELLDFVTENPYHSPASLSAMSLAAQNRILIEPKAVLDQATVCGKTNIITVGIVFTNTGTRVASSGNAYCALTIGNLHTGPSVSVLLFGSVYSRFCRSCRTGKVVALVNPRLIPPKGDSSRETTVTFSVNDERQLLLVGDARDYGVCKAMVRGKRDGKWVPDAKRCRNFIDKRVSEYCMCHRKQEKLNGSSVKGTLAMQKLRVEARASATAQGKKLIMPQQGSLAAQLKQERNISAQALSQYQPQTGLGSNALASAVNTAGRNRQNSLLNPPGTKPYQPTSANPLLNPGRQLQPISKGTQPYQPTSTNPLLNPGRQLQPISKSAVEGRCLSNTRSMAHSNLTTIVGRPSVRTSSLSPKGRQAEKLDWLQRGTTKRRTSLTEQKAAPKRRAVNTDTAGFDGSVPVPKPSRIFGCRPATAAPRANARLAVDHNKVKNDILSRQKEVVTRMSDQKASAPKSVSSEGNTSSDRKRAAKPLRTSSNVPRRSPKDDPFALIGDIDKDKVMHARSRFKNEVDAEEYARSRSLVCELERKESAKNMKESKAQTRKNNETGSNAIQKEWFCSKCERSYSRNPLSCRRSGHDVKLRRRIIEGKTIGEKRTALSNKKVEDGGLKLGRGLEWSRWNRSA